MTGVFAMLALLAPTAALDNGVGILPPLGYNTWNALGCSGMSEASVRAAAETLVKTGLRELGYRYVNLDDCWQDPNGRDPWTGEIRPDLTRFPSGMKGLADYLHGTGLLFGIYTDRGLLTCAGRVGSLGHVMQDAQTFASWDVDYVKEDNCYSSTGPNDEDMLFYQFGLFRDALNSTGRSIFFSVCGGGSQLPLANLSYYATDPRGGKNLANAWRVAPDCVEWLTCRWGSAVASRLYDVAGLGGFNDPDMLLASSKGAARRLTPKHSRTQFSLWAILMAPMLIGARLELLDSFDLETYSNSEVLAVSQDALGRQGMMLAQQPSIFEFPFSVWGRPLGDGSWAVLFLNDSPILMTISCDADCWAKLPFAAGTRLHVRDLWTHGEADRPLATVGVPYSVDVPSWGASVMLKFRRTNRQLIAV